MHIRKLTSKLPVNKIASFKRNLAFIPIYFVLFCFSKKVPKKETTKAKFELHSNFTPFVDTNRTKDICSLEGLICFNSK
jgi:hypothetical protein